MFLGRCNRIFDTVSDDEIPRTELLELCKRIRRESGMCFIRDRATAEKVI